MIIEELLRDSDRRRFAATPEADALRDEDALQEAYLLGSRFDAVRSIEWLLFDCRGALQIEMGNTAVIAVHGVESIRWAGEARTSARTQWSVVGWSPAVHAGRWSLAAAMVPSCRLEIVGRGAEFYVGDVPGCDDAPPDFLDATDEELRTGLAGWSSEFDPVHASFLDL